MILSGTLLQWRGLTVAGDRNQGHRVYMETLDGWGDWEGDGESIRRPLAHGSFDAPVHVPERLVTIAGMVSGSDRDEVRLTLERELVPGVDLEPLTITSEGRTLTAMARLDRVSLPRTVWGAGIFRYAIRWRCPDPLRYGPPQLDSTGFAQMLGGLEFPPFTDGDGTDTGFLEFGDTGSQDGLVTVSSTGTADAHTVYTVTGPVPDAGFDLVSQGDRIRFAFGVPTDSTLTIDSATGVALLDGSDYSVYLTVRDWWPVHPGESRTVAFVSLGGASAAQLSASTAPAFW